MLFLYKIPYSIYAEANLSANNQRNNMRELLKVFGLLEKDLNIYLREDRKADSSLDDKKEGSSHV